MSIPIYVRGKVVNCEHRIAAGRAVARRKNGNERIAQLAIKGNIE